MDFKVLATTFAVVFLAELGDKTQLAAMGMAADGKSGLSVFLGSALALCASSALAVLVGSWMAKNVPPDLIRYGAGAMFVVIGIWMLAFSGR